MPSVIEPALRKLAHYIDMDPSKQSNSVLEMISYNWYLGFTAFGGPAFRRRFVEKYPWLDTAMYNEMFALCQALPGPGSTKMIFAINLIHGGALAGMLSFFIWSLPGAIAAYALAVGVSQINETLPAPVYALLSGLNAATVGIIALAAVQLSEKAINDRLTRILVFLGGSAGMLYNALWYFPVLMAGGGAATIIWDYKWGHRAVGAAKTHALGWRRHPNPHHEEEQVGQPVQLQQVYPDHPAGASNASIHRVNAPPPPAASSSLPSAETPTPESSTRIIPPPLRLRVLSWKLGLGIITAFFVFFIAIMVLRGTLSTPPLGFAVFANLFLAGTIIFGGGPVVIPLLREYVVAQGWVSARDFLLGLAITQAFPGPNFNFAVYLGALAVTSPSATALHAAAGAAIGYVAIFAPGIVLHTGTMGVWKVLRNRRWFTSGLRGVNATAVGLIYTAVYRLWEQGFLGEAFSQGSSLGGDPWWIVVTATSFVGGRWFGVSAPVAILLGGAMGMVWYGIVRR